MIYEVVILLTIIEKRNFAMEMKKSLLKLLKKIKRPDVIAYIYLVVVDILDEFNLPTS